MGTDATQPVDYQAVLADLRAKREQIDTAIAAIEQLIVGRPASASSGVGAPAASAEQHELRQDEFFGMSIAQAAAKYLGMRRRALTTQEIAEALEKGGFPHTSENWGNTVGSVLMRSEKSGGEIVRVKRGTWGLATWYPNRRKAANGDKSKAESADTDDEDGNAEQNAEPLLS